MEDRKTLYIRQDGPVGKGDGSTPEDAFGPGTMIEPGTDVVLCGSIPMQLDPYDWEHANKFD